MTSQVELPAVDVPSLFKCKLIKTIEKSPLTGEDREKWTPEGLSELQIYDTSPDSTILTGWWRSKGNAEGQYPDNYLKMISYLFGKEPNTIEICSRYVEADGIETAATVDIKPPIGVVPTYMVNAETLTGIPSRKFKRARLDPPYTRKWAEEVYGNERVPDFTAMLKAAARVTDIGGLIFMLMGQGCVDQSAKLDKPMHSGNLQECKPYGLKRIGIISISVVPNKEYRFINIYVKLAHPEILERDDFGGQNTLEF